jgi:4-diphosphocytidyl-2-C-methyl-D-erythritol kinase
VTRAAQALAQELGRPLQADIRLTKNLPVASGIGGGSADAAATLISLCRLWGVEPASGLLQPLARRLGQDVPACLDSTPAQFVGIGDTTRRAPAMPPAWLVLVNPGVALPTPHVFAAYRNQPAGFSAAAPLGAVGDFAELADGLARRRNDLQQAATMLAPQIADVLAALAACEGCALARMSGSGATCFGLFASADHARRAAARVARSRSGWWVTATSWYRGRGEPDRPSE